MHELVLGTAQWGDPYGVTNLVGRLSDQELTDIAAVALESGITRVDTASGYGDAELRLRPWAARFSITTKVVGSGPMSVLDQLESSLRALGVSELDGCLVHDWPSLDPAQAAAACEGLEGALRRGLVRRAGVSAYEEVDLEAALASFGSLGAVQVPVSVVDQRLATSSAVAELMTRHVEIQARSVFLQGLLAARSGVGLARHPDVTRFHDWCEGIEASPIAAALGFIRSLPWVSHVVVGVTSAQELRVLTEAWSVDLPEVPYERFASSDTALIDPRRWAQP